MGRIKRKRKGKTKFKNTSKKNRLLEMLLKETIPEICWKLSPPPPPPLNCKFHSAKHGIEKTLKRVYIVCKNSKIVTDELIVKKKQFVSDAIKKLDKNTKLRAHCDLSQVEVCGLKHFFQKQKLA